MNTVAQTIAQQIGNRAFFMMGTKLDKWADGNALIFKVRGSKRVKMVKVTLAADDTYTVGFFGLAARKVAECECVYVEQLHCTIEQHTGLYLSL